MAAVGFGQGITAQEIFEKDGLYYRIANPDDDIVYVTLPDGVQYSGDITLVPYVTHNDKTYMVWNGSWGNAFTYSAIENFTVEDGFCGEEGDRPYNIPLTNDTALQTVTIKSFQVPVYETQINSIINVGNSPDCAHLFMRQEGDKSYIMLDKFNVYGPDGEKLKPFLHIDGKAFSDSAANIYPDENGVFTLDSNWRYNDEYCCVLSISQYFVVFLHVEYEGKYAIIRCQPEPYQTGVYTEADGVRYMVLENEVAVAPPAPGKSYSGELNIPESVTYNSRELPVTVVTQMAFNQSAITAVTLPASINRFIDYSPFTNCPDLEYVDLSATNIREMRVSFANCPKLTEVLLPDSLAYMPSTFRRCPALEEIRIPRGCSVSDAFSECPGLVDIQLVSNDETQGSVRVNTFNVLDMDGNPIPYEVYGYTNQRIEPEVNGDVYTFNKSDFYYYPYEWQPDYKRYTGNVTIGFDFEASDYLEMGSTFGGIQIPEQATQTGVSMTAVDEDAPVEFYNLQGLKVNASALTPGIYIRRQGASASKVLVK